MAGEDWNEYNFASKGYSEQIKPIILSRKGTFGGVETVYKFQKYKLFEILAKNDFNTPDFLRDDRWRLKLV